jgi:hypothetical protein
MRVFRVQLVGADVVVLPDQWLPDGAVDGEVKVFSNPFEDPPEATAEPEPGATIYIRVPMALKRSVDEAARAANLSSNVWVMRSCCAMAPTSDTTATFDNTSVADVTRNTCSEGR